MTTPLGTLVRGLAAGAAGAGAQSLFLAVAKPIIPAPAPDAYDPPDPEQADESEVETVARRFVEGFLRRGPLTKAQKKVLGQLMHYGFGARWGALYALARDSYPALGEPVGVASFATGVWVLGDNLLLQLMQVAGPMSAYPVRTHVVAFTSNLVFGAGLAASDELLARSRRARLGALGLATLGLGWAAIRLVGAAESRPSAARARRRQPATAS